MTDLKNPSYFNSTNLFKDKSIVITAAAGSGIGFATAKRFLEEGANVFISDSHSERLDQAIQELRGLNLGSVDGCKCDVTNDNEINEMFSIAENTLNNIDVLVNNAGLGGDDLLETMSNDAWNKVIDITLNGTMRVIRAGIPFLKQSKGVIVNNASVLGWRAQKGQSHYAAAKAGVMALTRCVALELVEHNIRVNAVAPSLALNPHLSKTNSNDLIQSLISQEAYGRGAEPWEIANIILFLASDLSSYMTGEVISASSQKA
tara:strand:+ start:11493 stop:12275 length:783 start_codon:yes stop_codon:yes gene_type:complete